MKILLAKLNHLGDTLLLTPTLRMLRERYPGAEIDVLVRGSCEVMLRGNPDVNRLLPVSRTEGAKRNWRDSLRRNGAAMRRIFARRYDYAFDLSNSDRAKFWIQMSRARVRGINLYGEDIGWKRRLFNRVSHLEWGPHHQALKDFRTVTHVMGIEAEAGPLRFHPQVDETALLSRLPELGDLARVAIIHPTSRWPYKQWMPDRWASVADQLAERGMTVLFSCGPAGRELAHIREIQAQAKGRHLATEGRISLHDLGYLMGRAKLFVGVDTVAMHLAAAMQVPLVGLFGPSQEWSWSPWKCRHELALGNCPCKHARVFTCDKSKPYPCMDSITNATVMAAVDKLLACP